PARAGLHSEKEVRRNEAGLDRKLDTPLETITLLRRNVDVPGETVDLLRCHRSAISLPSESRQDFACALRVLAGRLWLGDEDLLVRIRERRGLSHLTDYLQ